jgi:hypothetical protein
MQQDTRNEAPERKQLKAEILNSKLLFPFSSPIEEVLMNLCLVLNPSDKLQIVWRIRVPVLSIYINISLNTILSNLGQLIF